MGDQADPDADYAAKVLAFDEDDIEGYASVVKKYFESEKGRELSVTSLKERVVRNNHENRGTSSESSPVHRGTFRPLNSAGQ